MKVKPIAAGLLCAALSASAALAQAQPLAQPPIQIQPPPAGNQNPLGATDVGRANTGFITQRTTGVLRASDLIEHDVVGPNGEDIGEVEDILLDRSGRVVAIVVEVDDTLGLGDDREVAVPIHAVQVNPIDMTATTGTIVGAGLPASTAGGELVRDQNQISEVLTPDRIVVTIPVDQLRSAPAFDDGDD